MNRGSVGTSKDRRSALALPTGVHGDAAAPAAAAGTLENVQGEKVWLRKH